ncbi:MAG: hypothetical protein ACKVYV_08325 [Limisphaerales bacterium]
MIAEVPALPATNKGTWLVASDVLVILGGLAVLTGLLLLAVWVARRKGGGGRRNRKRAHGPEILQNSEDYTVESVPSDDGDRRKRRYRRRRREHRPRNPTLAETTGLPQARDGQGAPPA